MRLCSRLAKITISFSRNKKLSLQLQNHSVKQSETVTCLYSISQTLSRQFVHFYHRMRCDNSIVIKKISKLKEWLVLDSSQP